MECVVEIAGGVATCLRCGRSMPTGQTDPSRFHRRCEAAEVPCPHRGVYRRDVGCKLGCSARLVAVYGCALHGECTAGRVFGRRSAELRCCLSCPDGPLAGIAAPPAGAAR